MTYYQPVIVSIALSRRIFQILDVEEYHDFEVYVRGHSPSEFMYDMYNAIFMPLILWVYINLFLHSELREKAMTG